MIYISTLLLIFCLIWVYDIRGYKPNKMLWYNLLLVWFILVSGFQYMVGADLPQYCHDFAKFKQDFSLDSFFTGDRKQPGWNLLLWLCRQLTDDFTIVKLILATCYHIAVFSFFKRESKYIFLCVFLFAVNTYLVTNFNVLRQCWAITFGLYALTSMQKGNISKYIVYTFLAFMFHNTAIILLVVPIFKFVKYNNKYLPLFAVAIIVCIYLLFTIDITEMTLRFIDAGLMNDELSQDAYGYLNSEKLGATGRTAQLGLQALLMLFVVAFYLYKKENFYLGGLALMYVLILIISTAFPILWRFRLYFDFPFFVVLSSVIIEAPLGKLKQIKFAFYIMALLIAFIFPYRDYVRKEPGQKHSYIDQYYPYHSILDPIKEERL